MTEEAPSDRPQGPLPPEAAGKPRDLEALLTIDELAARCDLTVRTVRFYAAKGLLPPPMRQGRVGYYTSAHWLRLDLIRELQDHGYGLAGIERHLGRIPINATGEDLAVYRARLIPWQSEQTEEFGRAELERRVGRTLDDGDVDFLLEVGFVERAADDDRFRATASMLAFGVELLSVPVPREMLREAASIIDEHAIALAAGLTEVFRKGVWEPFRRGDLAGPDAEQLASVMARLRRLTVQGLMVAFERAADDAVRNPDLHQPVQG